MKKIINFFIMFFPWKIKRRILQYFYHYDLHSEAYIGFAYIYPKYLRMDKGAFIGHLNIAIHLDTLIMGKNTIIARENWITGFPTHTESKHFSHQLNRKSELIIGDESSITKRHHIDCTNQIIIGKYVTIAGYNSQLLTHSINIYKNIQDSYPIEIGDYCFVGTDVKILGGSKLPAYSVLAAGAVLNKSYSEEWKLYAGVPARPLKNIDHSAKYFSRKSGFVF